MAIITFGCERCGAQIVTRNASEALAWDKSHDAVCVALTCVPPPPRPVRIAMDGDGYAGSGRRSVR